MAEGGLPQNTMIPLGGEHLGAAGSVPSLRALVEGLSSTAAIRLAAMINHKIESALGDQAGTQKRLVGLFPEETQTGLIELLTTDGPDGVDIIFSRQQMLVLQRLALSAGVQDDLVELTTAMKEDFLLAAAQLHDVIEDVVLPSTDQYQPDRKIAAFLGRLGNISRPVSLQRDAGRSYAIWSIAMANWPTKLPDPDEVCRDRFGCGLREYQAILAAPAFSALLAQHEPTKGASGIDPMLYFSEVPGINPATAAEVLAEHTFQPDVGDTFWKDPATYLGIAAFEARPYMPAGADVITAAAPSLAFRRATTGLFWMMHEQLSGQNELLSLTQHLGDAFEQYCLRLARPLASDFTHVSGEVKYGTAKGDVMSSDIIVSSLGPPAGRAFVEVANLRPARPFQDQGDLGSFDTYLERLIGKLTQLDARIQDHRLRSFAIDGDPITIGISAPYWPVLVIDDGVVWTEQFQDHVDGKMSYLFAFPETARPVILTISDWEYLVTASEAGQPLGDLLMKYLTREPRDSWDAFLVGRGVKLSPPALVMDAYEQMMNEWTDVLEPKSV